jgi:hypothetical protein
MLSALTLLIMAQEAADRPPVMSEETRACIQEFAPHIESAFASLLDGANYVVEFVCAEQIRADVVAFASRYPAPDWRVMLNSGGSDTYYVVEDSTAGQHGDAEPAEASQEVAPSGEVFGISDEYRDMWANYTPPPRIQVVQPQERPAEIMEYIGRTLLEIRINRNETERQEDN